MVRMDLATFEELVSDALDGIPPQLRSEMENVAIVVDDESPPGNLYGLYVGVPLTERGNHYSSAAPDRITIFMATILAASHSREEVVDRVRTTVVHEVAHHFGIGDRRLEELGWA
jgi:predicted Zn-dependent protease with MMP-like domain